MIAMLEADQKTTSLRDHRKTRQRQRLEDARRAERRE
jgi:hypothetical protein